MSYSISETIFIIFMWKIAIPIGLRLPFKSLQYALRQWGQAEVDANLTIQNVEITIISKP